MERNWRTWGTQDNPEEVIFVSSDGYVIRLPVADLLGAGPKCSCGHRWHDGPCSGCGHIAFHERVGTEHAG